MTRPLVDVILSLSQVLMVIPNPTLRAICINGQEVVSALVWDEELAANENE